LRGLTREILRLGDPEATKDDSLLLQIAPAMLEDADPVTRQIDNFTRDIGLQ